MTRLLAFIRRLLADIDYNNRHVADTSPRQQNHANLPPVSRGNRMPRK